MPKAKKTAPLSLSLRTVKGTAQFSKLWNGAEAVKELRPTHPARRPHGSQTYWLINLRLQKELTRDALDGDRRHTELPRCNGS